MTKHKWYKFEVVYKDEEAFPDMGDLDIPEHYYHSHYYIREDMIVAFEPVEFRKQQYTLIETVTGEIRMVCLPVSWFEENFKHTQSNMIIDTCK